jgi:hypothetical protein
MVEGREWTYDEAIVEERHEDLGPKLRHAGLSPLGWDLLAALARDVVADPVFRVRALIVAEALRRDGFLTGDEFRKLIR